MSDFRSAAQQLGDAMLRLRPFVRPYINGAIWLVLLLALAYDVYRFLDGHPRSLGSAAYTYGFGLGYLLVDHVLERRFGDKTGPNEKPTDES